MKPTRSPKRHVTTFRSSRAGAAASSGVAHCEQKRASSAFSCPQLGQVRIPQAYEGASTSKRAQNVVHGTRAHAVRPLRRRRHRVPGHRRRHARRRPRIRLREPSRGGGRAPTDEGVRRRSRAVRARAHVRHARCRHVRRSRDDDRRPRVVDGRRGCGHGGRRVAQGDIRRTGSCGSDGDDDRRGVPGSRGLARADQRLGALRPRRRLSGRRAGRGPRADPASDRGAMGNGRRSRSHRAVARRPARCPRVVGARRALLRAAERRPGEDAGDPRARRASRPPAHPTPRRSSSTAATTPGCESGMAGISPRAFPKRSSSRWTARTTR